jgi:transcriptional regulator GlxA family with amidase domain
LSKPTENPSLRIAILAFPGCMGSEILAINDVLLLAGHIASAQRSAPVAVSTVEVVGLAGRPVPLAGGLMLATQRPAGHYDVVIVPGLEISQLNDWDAKLAPLQRELAFIRKSFASGSAIASVCVGSFLLAEAGLLDQRKATTAWLCVPQLAQRYPAVAVQADAVMVEDGAVLTTGAVSSAFDLAILLVKRTLGARVATATARVALLSAQRVSQAPYVDAALIAPGLPSFSQSVGQWLQSRLTEVYDLDRLAQAFHVSSRTLLRRVKAETGRSPLVLLQQARIDKAKQLLLETRWSQDRITQAVGYADTGTFARLFASQVGISPARFRRLGL